MSDVLLIYSLIILSLEQVILRRLVNPGQEVV